jgi:hypothetical protein
VPGRRFDIEKHAYLRDLYNCIAQTVVVYKAGQMGASEYGISYALHAADVRNATPLYVFPTDKHVSDFSAARIGPAVEASEYLQQIVVSGDAGGGVKGADRVTLKRVGDRFLYLRGARVDPDGTAAQLKAIDADVLILDELDEMDPRAPSIAEKRLGHSVIAEKRIISTPRYGGHGIHAEWMRSDQREWAVRCGSCGERQPMTIHQVVQEWDALGRPIRWHGDDEGRAWAACRKCGKELDRLGPGQWVAANPESAIVGFHLTKLFSPARAMLDVVQALQTVDETKRREANNQDLGEPYTPKGGGLTDEVLDTCKREYAHGAAKGETTSLGCDVGKVLHVVIRGPAQEETGERPQRFAGTADWDGLGRLIKEYHVEVAVMDALPETTKARELQAEFQKVVFLAYYTVQKVGSKKPEAAETDYGEGTVTIDRTRTMDETFAAFVSQVNTLPADIDNVRDYRAQLKAPIRVLEEGPGGQQVARYVESGPDHFAHAENYCWIAGTLVPRRTRPSISWV